ncbi:MAG: sigma-54 interaction domain-containing protein [Halothiobacillaceae bacterium]
MHHSPNPEPLPEHLVTEDDTGEADLLVIHEAAKLLAEVDHPQMAIGGLLRLMSQMVGLNRGRVLLPDPDGRHIRIVHAYGLTDDEKHRGVYASGEGLTGRVMSTGQIVVVQDIDDEPMYLQRAVDRSTLPPETVAYVAVPILEEKTVIGVLGAHRLRRRRRPFSRDLVLLRVMAAFVSQILRVTRLIGERTAMLTEENRALKQALEQQMEAPHGILGESPALKHALRQALHVAPTHATVLLTGESGTGKEKFARMVHETSDRREGPFMAINCAAIPEQLLESELFGHERGAFTGAVATKKGVVELASGGTLFLDEIGDLALELQSKLLHVLEKHYIHRVGGTREIAVDVRIIAATHKNLQNAVNEGRFRIDLFYRLNVFPIHLPPLRDRAGDVARLARHFLQEAGRDYGRDTLFAPGVVERLEAYNWPGNIRQLENVVKRAVLVARDRRITQQDIEVILGHESHVEDHLEAGTRRVSDRTGRAPGNRGRFDDPVGGAPGLLRGYAWVREDEAEDLLDALRQSGGNKTRAAMLLGMTPRQFRYRLDKLGLRDDTARR